MFRTRCSATVRSLSPLKSGDRFVYETDRDPGPNLCSDVSSGVQSDHDAGPGPNTNVAACS